MSEKLNLIQKLIEIRKTIGILQKTEAGNKGAKYVDPEVLLLKARDGMDKHGVLLTCEVLSHTVTQIKAPTKNDPNNVDFLFNGTLVYKWLDSESGGEILCNWVATATHMQDPSMAFGGALTYSERYFMMKFFQIPTPRDDPESLKGKAGVLEFIDEKQISQLTDMLLVLEKTDEDYCNFKNVSSLKEIPKSLFNDCVAELTPKDN